MLLNVLHPILEMKYQPVGWFEAKLLFSNSCYGWINFNDIDVSLKERKSREIMSSIF